MKRSATIVLIVLMLFHVAVSMAQDAPVEDLTEEPTATPTATVFFLPTATPIGDWVDAASATGAYVRAGPGLRFSIVTSLANGTVVEPVGRDQEKGWIMVRIGDGFAWVLRPLVRWVTDLDSLPILYIGALTPSPTFTASLTLSPTATFTSTATATQTETATNTATFTPTFTPTDTASPTATFTMFASNTPLPTVTTTPSPSATFTDTPIPTATLIPTETYTSVPTNTATDVPTATPTETHTSAPTNTATVVPTDVPPTSTATPLPTNTATVAPTDVPPTQTFTATSTNTATIFVEPTTEVPLATALLLATAAPTEASTIAPPSPTDAPAVLLVATEPPTLPPTDAPSLTAVVPTNTGTSIATETPTTVPSAAPTQTFTAIPSETSTFQPSPTVQVEPIIVAAEPTVTLPISVTPENPSLNDSALVEANAAPALSLPGEAIVAGVILLIVAGYVAAYWRGASAVERYADGFVVDDCPVCKHGALHVETHVGRVLGIPQPRSVVTCDNCRSVLREVGRRRWRYAVDRSANPMLFGQFNGRVVDEDKLVNLSVWNQTLDKPPKFEEEAP